MELIDELLLMLFEVNNLELTIPKSIKAKQKMLRHLFNITQPGELPIEYYQKEAIYLKEEMKKKSITKIGEIKEELSEGIYIWQGDITTLEIDAIVNAANSEMLGCFIPHHGCIDNAIHSASGLRLRLECKRLMDIQGHEEPTGKAKITSGYSLPSKYVVHTVGPIVSGALSKEKEEQLRQCYMSCLNLCGDAEDIRNVAFCSISTGVFKFPKQRAAQIALETIKEYLMNRPFSLDKVLINVFSEEDYYVYKNTAENNYGN